MPGLIQFVDFGYCIKYTWFLCRVDLGLALHVEVCLKNEKVVDD